MKVITVLLLALATVSAGTLPNPKPVHPRDRTLVQSIESRIIGGEAAVPGQFPYQVGCVFSAIIVGWFCGGSIFSPKWIMTAAHCTDGAIFADIYLGSVIMQSGTVVSVTFANFKQHPGYKSNSVNHDISLIKLNKPIQFDANIGKTGLPSLTGPPNTYEGQMATVSGWGRTSNNGSQPSNLRFVTVEVIPNSECDPKYPNLITDKMVCTSVLGPKATCSGDSGGPLVIGFGTSDPIQIGIVSFGSAAGCDISPSVFTRVSSYLDWIEATIGV